MSEQPVPRIVYDATTADAQPDLQVYVAKHNLRVNGKTFAPGHRVQFSDPEQIAELRAFGAIALEEEVRAAEDLAAERQRQARENEDLRNRLAQLEAQLTAAQTRNQQSAAASSVAQRGKGGRFVAGITGSADNPGAPAASGATGSSGSSGASAAAGGDEDGEDGDE